MWMVDKNRSEAETDTRLREKSGQTEKITINVGFVDLGHIDSLVHEGLLLQSHRLRQDGGPQRLVAHAEAIKQSIVRHALELGLPGFTEGCKNEIGL